MQPEAEDPVAAYDRIAPSFGLLAERRKLYLDRVDELVISHVPEGSRSLLDVGAGDGRRAGRIAQARHLTEVVLLEPSQGMQRQAPGAAAFRTMRAEQLHALDGPFDAIICLWNVLGHVFPQAARVQTLRQLARLVGRRGRIFVDVNHRYNAAEYGAVGTALRFLRDRIRPSETNGDAVVTWNTGGAPCRVRGHVFTDREFRLLARASGLTIERRFTIDYASGRIRRLSLLGNLLYMLRPAGTE